MRVIGLTGGVGMGKTTVAAMAHAAGAAIIDTDALARELVEPGQPALVEISQAFGAEILQRDGSLNRHSLAERVFSDPAARFTLEQILHPRIRALWKARLEALRCEQTRQVLIVIPLLFETHSESEFDSTVCVACSGDSQHARLSQRGWSDGHICQRLAAQWSVQEKVNRSDFVVWTEGPLPVTDAQVARVLRFCA